MLDTWEGTAFSLLDFPRYFTAFPSPFSPLLLVVADVRVLKCQVLIWTEDKVFALFGSLADFPPD